jgi:hypothetical protein
MATYETSKSAEYGVSYGPGAARQIVCDTVSVAITTAMLDNANDDVGLLWLPKGAVIVYARLDATDMDESTGLVLDVGIAGTEELILANVTIGQAGGSSVALAAAGFLYKCTARTQLRAYVSTAATTGVAGTLKFAIQYFVDEDFSTTALVAA